MIAQPLTTLVGRGEQIDVVADLVRGHRLVMLAGSGGCGKTRLAVEIARRVEPNFDDGVVAVELAAVESEALVPSVVAACAGVSDAGGTPVSTLLRTKLANRQYLLVLDNCEHLLDACAVLVHDLLLHCPGLTVLATSRVPLGVDGEVIWRVPSLSLPSVDAGDLLAEINESESGRLLVDRAQLARPDFVLTDDNARDVISICRRLDGVPLAIELAASRLRALAVSDLAAALDGRFSVLGPASRTAPPRQRTLEASIDWSYRLLDGVERTLFRRLSVFAGPFDITAVEAVCADELVGAEQVCAAVANLVDHSLVQADSGGEPRYRLLESVRAFGLQHLVDGGEETTWRNRHLAWVRSITGWYDGMAEFGDLALANERIGTVLDEVRGALGWGRRSSQATAAAAIAADLRLFWITDDRGQEGRMWTAATIDEAARDQRPDAAIHRARAQVTGAQLALIANDPFSQQALAADALETIRLLDARSLEPLALVLYGWAQVFLVPDDAPSALEPAYNLAEDLGDDARGAFASLALGMSSVLRGDLEAATCRLRTGASTVRPPGSTGRYLVRGILAYTYVLRGQLEDAEALLDEVLDDATGFDQTGIDFAHTVRGITHALRGRWHHAQAALQDVVQRAGAAGRMPAQLAQLHLAMVLRALTDHDECLRQLNAAEPALAAPGLAWFRTQAMTWRAEIAASRGDHAGAEKHWRAALSVAEPSGNPLSICVAKIAVARGAREASDPVRARHLGGEALQAAVSAGYRLGAVDALELLATLPTRDQADLLAAVDAERTRIGYVRFPVDEPSYSNAVAEVGELPSDAPSFDAGVSIALGRDVRTNRDVSGWGSLTPSELRVAHLVAEGLTNREVGEKLFISRRTVQAHLSHIYAKLGVSNRVEMTAAAAQLGSRS